MFCACCERQVLRIKECSIKSGKSLRMRMINAKHKGLEKNFTTVCRGCDSLLDNIGNCVAAAKFYIHLGEKIKLGIGSSAGTGYVRKFA